ncbi:MAG TPA: porin family protein [Candidatus Mcinerneyibacteriales bacterium]|nr:porin family protein [Candidatus Mcinerneyibacteriales bacterium]HPQ89161.1 porin family protein [Candidatus Mcinerneyibacteriales bacterium]
MKKMIFVVLALILVVGLVQASDMRFGAKAGLTLGNINKDVEDMGMPAEADKKMRMGMTFGAMMHMPVGENMVFMAEGAYIQKGVGVEFMDEEMTMKIDYLQFDALMKYAFADAFGIYAGPGFGFVMAAEQEYPDGSMDIKDFVKSSEFSLNFGAQFMATENIVLDARYNMGLTTIPDEEEAPEVMSRTISLTVGYLF